MWELVLKTAHKSIIASFSLKFLMKMLFIIIKEAGYYDLAALPISNKNIIIILYLLKSFLLLYCKTRSF